jgi:type IV pilus assembly protein PilQ
VATRIYRPNYVTAQELQALVTGLLTETVGKISVTSVPESGIGKDENKTGGESFASGAALLVQDYESVLSEIDQIVAEIDVRPMQVSIEAMILSVALDDTFKFGVDFGLLRDREHVALATGSPLGNISSMAFNGGLKFAFLDSSLGTFLTALETVGDTNVIATPRLMCLNKQRAEILIGEQLGYVNTTVTETSATQSVEFLEVGAQLRLRPFIYSDGTIRMEVHPELSTGSVEVEGGFTLPKKDVTQVTTNIMVRDGCTVVIGGLMREDLERNTTQVPLFGSLPGVGWLFRTRDYHTRKREIMVLVTPRIVYDPQTCAEGDQLACEIDRRQDTVENSMSPVAQRYLAKRCYLRAKETWEAGDDERAWHWIKHSVRLDPLNRDALALHAQVGAQIDPNHPPAKVCPADNPLEGDRIAPWLLDELQQRGGPLHPHDPGQTGRKVDIERQRSS